MAQTISTVPSSTRLRVIRGIRSTVIAAAAKTTAQMTDATT